MNVWLVSTSRNIVTQVFLRLAKERLECRDLSIWIKGKFLGGGNFGKVIYMYINLNVYWITGVLICVFPIFGVGETQSGRWLKNVISTQRAGQPYPLQGWNILCIVHKWIPFFLTFLIHYTCPCWLRRQWCSRGRVLPGSYRLQSKLEISYWKHCAEKKEIIWDYYET